MKRITTTLLLIPMCITAFYAFDWFLNTTRLRLLPKNFSEVTPGVLYRSGQLRKEHFERVLAENEIRTVVCLNPGEQDFEASISQRMGVRFVAYGMPGSGVGESEYFHEILELLAEPASHPVLVHCNAGAYRTGASVALYRMVYCGWTLEDAVAEMKYSGFAGQQDLIDHVRQVHAAIPLRLRERIARGKETTDELR